MPRDIREAPHSIKCVDKSKHQYETQAVDPVTDLMRPSHGQSFHKSNPGQSASDYIEPLEYNVLVVGETQSGKSTLIQYMKKYADPTEVSDSSTLGNGAHSKTMEVISTSITTDLPEYHVIKKGGDRLRYGVHGDVYDYEEFLERKDLELKKGSPRLDKKVQFNLIDTPGLNTTVGDDETHIQKIFDALIKAKKIHLLLITVSCGPVTRGFKDAIQACADMFPGLKGIIAFVHTHFCYDNLHPARTQASQAFDIRAQSLHKIMGRESFPHFKIDCHVHGQVTRDCITRSTIQRILELARFNHPVDMIHTTINKTPRMSVIDSILQDKFKAIYECMHMTLSVKDREQADFLKEIFYRETKVHKLEAQIKVLDEYLSHHDVAQLELLHEDRREMGYTEDGEWESGSIRYPESGQSEFPIKKADIHCQGVDVILEVNEVDREGSCCSWEAKVRRVSSDHSVLHVRIYSTKALVHRAKIQIKRHERAALERQLQGAIRHREEHVKNNESNEQSIKELVDHLNEAILVLRQVCRQSLEPETFKALLDARAYDGDISACAKEVQKVYIAQAKLRLEASPQRHEASPRD